MARYFKINANRGDAVQLGMVRYFNLFSFFRMILEVFLRKNFGDRYFNQMYFALLALILLQISTGLPLEVWGWMFGLGWNPIRLGIDDPLLIVFTIAFIVMGIKHRVDINRRRTKGLYDTGAYSLYEGDRLPIFKRERILGIKNSPILTEQLYEPLPFFIAGLIMREFPFTAPLGWLWFISSIAYSLSHVLARYLARQDILGKIDSQIQGEDLAEILIDERVQTDEKGFKQESGEKSKDEFEVK